MKERPILFSGPMVRAILDGEKTQTRRPIKPQPPEWIDRWGYTCFTPPGHISGRGYWKGVSGEEGSAEKFFRSPHGLRGDRLWVRETWDAMIVPNERIADPNTPTARDSEGRLHYLAYRADDGHDPASRWRSPIHMPRWASRLTLEITSVRVERLQQITDADVIAEGFDHLTPLRFAWDAMYRRKPGLLWIDDPWVWVVGFRRVGDD